MSNFLSHQKVAYEKKSRKIKIERKERGDNLNVLQKFLYLLIKKNEKVLFSDELRRKSKKVT